MNLDYLLRPRESAIKPLGVIDFCIALCMMSILISALLMSIIVIVFLIL